MIKTLRFQVAIRFFSLCPNETAKTLLRNARELIERSKKQEALCRSEQSKEDKDVDEGLFNYILLVNMDKCILFNLVKCFSSLNIMFGQRLLVSRPAAGLRAL